MAATTYSATNAWSASNRYTALTLTDVMVIYPSLTGAGAVAFSTTMGDAQPSITPAQAAKVLAGDKYAIQLLPQERLWIATDGIASATATLEISGA